MPDRLDLNQSAEPTVNAEVNQDEEAQKDVKMVKTLKGRAAKGRAEYDKDWPKRWDYYKGKQWDANRPGYRAKPVINLIRITIQSVLPILTDAKPGFNVTPREPNDFEFATSMGNVTEHWWDNNTMDITLVEGLMDSMIFDYGILKVSWDPEAEDGAGDVKVEVKKPEDIFFENEAVDFNKNNGFVIERSFPQVGELRRKHPEFADAIKPDGAVKKEQDEAISTDVTLVSPVDRRSSADGNSVSPQPDDGQTAEVWECWIDSFELENYEETLPDGSVEKGKKKKYPDGLLITILPNQNLRLQKVNSPYKHKQKPYIRLVDHILPRRLQGEGEAEPIWETQRGANKFLANIMDYSNFMGNPIWKTEAGNGVDPNRLTNQFGAVITTKDNKIDTVKREIPPPLPQYILEFYQFLIRMAEMESGVQEVSQGRRPKGVTAAQAIESLQEAAQTRIRLKERNLQNSLSQLGKQVISLMMQYYKEPRIARITGKGEWPEFFEFFVSDELDENKQPTGKMIFNQKKFINDPETGKPMPDNAQIKQSQPSKGIFDVKIHSGTALPHQKTQRANVAFKLREAGDLSREGLYDALDWPNAEEELKRLEEQAALMPPEEPGAV
jgi:hypothetical protein